MTTRLTHRGIRPSNEVEIRQLQYPQSDMDTDSFQSESHFTGAGLVNLSLRQAHEECDLGIEWPDRRIRSYKPSRSIWVYETLPVRFQSEPEVLYWDGAMRLSIVPNTHHDFPVDVRASIPYGLDFSPDVSLIDSQPRNLPSLIGSGEYRSRSDVLWLTNPETRVRVDWSVARETFAHLQEYLPYSTANLVLATLQVSNPEAVARIRKLTHLEQDWDGYGGKPLTQKAIKETAKLLLEIYELTHGQLENPFIAPLPDGGLELEWELNSGAELMLVIPPTGTDIEYLEESRGSGQSEGIIPTDATLGELIDRLAQ